MGTLTTFHYKRVRVEPGKHGRGDYRVTIGDIAPTHGEILAILWWVFVAEDRYKGLGRRMLWLLIKEAYEQDGMPLEEILHNADGPDRR